ncbi:CRISPR-associated helicase Cas3' [Xylophilus ampelinus]|uniref:CRISPR-associated Cas3 family helicase n=1 Tax=Xylophilus ampelinus TaxID=54067 RepID=A0A318SZF2_9BURK|nr:CRISPR-associated helicase Cas3' [Xylophilus ampelinus]MCS4509971.1 CRISPR-associated helicase Cas3' [Xylophilus ampelinus]PYE78451.1 CRISPR-associated Cas3 family helicase [Xylophilus ampelinus]
MQTSPPEQWIAWGKLGRAVDGSVEATHPLLDHMADVAAVLETVLHLPAVQRALERAAGRPLSDVDRARLAVLAFLHDIGKANAGFQVRYWRERAERPAAWTVAECGHGSQGWALFGQSLHGAARVTAGLPLQAMETWGDAVRPLLHASISHHGRPVGDEATFSIWQPVRDGVACIYDPAVTVAAMGARVQVLYPQAFATKAPDLPDAPVFAHLFAGLVQLADWLGSDTRPGFFPYTRPGEDRATTALQCARHALRAVGLDVGGAAVRLASTACDFAQAFGVPSPRPMQAAMADDSLGPVVVLEAETGSGKTEAALWRFLHLWRAGQVDALYFALPTRVAASQLYERVQAFVHRVWPVDAPVAVRALPGYTAADGETPQALPDFQVLWSDTPGDAEAERRWAAESPKRYLAATIAVGTVDQALLGALQIKHAHLRQAMLARSLLVVDEVHASDAYMTRLLEHLLRAHMACGGQALLLSATLGASARSRYLSIGGNRRTDSVPPPLAQAQALPYPAIGHRAAGGPTLLPVEGNPRHKTVYWETWDQIDAPDAIAVRAVEAAAAGARVLVVRNTVPAAVATLKAVEALAAAQGLDCLFRVGDNGGASTLHHSRFSRQDRPLLDAEVQAQVGKQRRPRGGLVVIGTQTLEQSLDIDADLLITDLCPMDVLLQRLGRLHRHERPSREAPNDHRPAGFERPCVWVLTPPGNDLSPLLQRQRHGLGPIRKPGEPMGGVYVDLRVVEATRRLITAQPTRSIPADNRLLVEQATHPDALDAITQALGEAWVRFGIDYEGALAATKTVANLHALSFDQPFDDVRFPENEGRIGSRLGVADRIVVFDPPQQGPFGKAVTQLAIRHHLLPRGLAPDAQASQVSALPDVTGFTFGLGSAHYRYTRLGVERLPSTTKESAHDAA